MIQQERCECGSPESTVGPTLWSDEYGQDMAEYAVLIALVALAVIAAVVLLGGSISNTFNVIGSAMNGADIPS